LSPRRKGRQEYRPEEKGDKNVARTWNKEFNMIRAGIGFDAHRFKAGRKLILGGVDIDFGFGLDGHSDADVLTHAVMDALLGAVAEGDIGKHFPDTDAKWKGARSVELLSAVADIVRKKGFEINNFDVTVIAERPKLAPHIDAMRAVLAEYAGIDIGCVSVKATTVEKMGAIGREEGIAAQAIAVLRRVDNW
jgi:2-C-methyl-D-erythritol 2,4-cyclodiphosphate synthase